MINKYASALLDCYNFDDGEDGTLMMELITALPDYFHKVEAFGAQLYLANVICLRNDLTLPEPPIALINAQNHPALDALLDETDLDCFYALVQWNAQ